MQLKREIKFETLRKSYKKQIIIGSVLVCVVGSILTFNLTKAKYRLTQSMKLVTGTINYKVPDLRIVALYTENDNNEYVESDDVPTSGYTLNEEKSLCRVYDGTTSVAEAPIDTKATITYQNGLVTFANISKKNTRCYLYFDLIEDSEIPIITNVETSSTENTITVNVTATDNIGVDKYYYQIDSEEVIEKTESSHTFTGLILGSSHTIKVYVKDGRGNTSEVTTKTVSTNGNSETTIAKLNINSNYIKSGNPDFTKKATGAETEEDNGVYKALDPMYGANTETYYWRGAATTNHLIFANKCWRIVRINGDGSIRLIYNGAIQSGNTCTGNGTNSGSIAVTSQTYSKGGASNNSAYVGYTFTASVQRPTPTTGGTESNLKKQTDSWYNSNIGNNATYAGKVVDGKYCNDRTIGSGTWSATGSEFYYGGYTRLYTNKTPTLGCDTQDVYTLKAGAITADEVSMAGGTTSSGNSSYYLYNGQDYWTMSPYLWNYYYSSLACMFIVYSSGLIVSYVGNVGDLSGHVGSIRGVRPVINLRSDVTFNSGSDGTQNNPYIVQ